MTSTSIQTQASATESWSIADVPEAFAAVSALADEFGFCAALLGSTVKAGQGRDLDVAMMRRMGQQCDWCGFLKKFGGEIVRSFANREQFRFSFEVARDGRLFHFCFGRF